MPETEVIDKSRRLGEKSLLLSLALRYSENNDPWPLVSGEMNVLCKKLNTCSINSQEDGTTEFTPSLCESECRQMQNNHSSIPEALRIAAESHAQSLKNNLINLEDRLRKIIALSKSENYDTADPFYQEMLRKFNQCSIERTGNVEDTTSQQTGETKSSRGRKRHRGTSETSSTPAPKKEVSEMVSPTRSARSLSSKKSVGSPSAAVPGRTRSSVNTLGSSPNTPGVVVEEEAAKLEPIDKPTAGTRSRSSSRVSQLPPLVIRIPQQPQTAQNDTVSPKQPVPVASPAAAKSPMTRQQQKHAGLELPTSPAPGSRPLTPAAASPSITSVSLQPVTASRRSPRVASTAGLLPVKEPVETPAEAPSTPSQPTPSSSNRSHRSRTKSDAAVPEAPSKTDKDEQAAHEERLARTTRRLLLQTWRQVANHRHAAIFLSPVTEDIAPNYSQIVFKPKDLSTIKQHIENGKITTVQELQLELMIMFENAMMYNGKEHTVHHMAADMYDDVMQHFEAYSTSGNERREAATAATQHSAATLTGSKKVSSRSRRRQSEVDIKPSSVIENLSEQSRSIEPVVNTSEDANMEAASNE